MGEETLFSIVSELADELGIYIDPKCSHYDDDDRHEEGCKCRIFWEENMEERIRSAVYREIAAVARVRLGV